MSYQSKVINCNKGNFGSSRKETKYIVIHYTAGNGDTAINNGNYFANNVTKTSAHFFVDEKMVVQSAPENAIAWHCGIDQGGKYFHKDCRNVNSLAIELCSRKDSKQNYYFKDETVTNAVELTRYLMKKYDIPASNVLRHYDVTHKLCPMPFVKNEILWQNFMERIREPEPGQPKKPRVNLQQWGCTFDKIEKIAYIPPVKNKLSTVSTAAKETRWGGRTPDAICNAELFNMTTGKPASGVVANGKEIFLPEALGFSFVDGKRPVLSYKNNLKAKDWIGAYPLLLRDGEKAYEQIPNGLRGIAARTALAINDRQVAIFYVKAADACGLDAFAEAILEKGFHTAINLDGGGSTACITPGVAYDQGRPVRGKIGIWMKGGNGNKLMPQYQAPPLVKNFDMMVNTTRGLNLRKEPVNGSIIEVLPYTTVIAYANREQTINNIKWYYVKTPNGNEGWVSSQYVKLL